MFEDSDILDAYHEAASKDETHHSLSLPPVRVLCIDGHNFIVCEIESKARACKQGGERNCVCDGCSVFHTRVGYRMIMFRLGLSSIL
jgi:hypothetical protein